MIKKIEKKDALFLLFCFVFSFLIMYICTASSPRYAINPWNDANAFFTMGKAMAKGVTIYKDLFEQKGPLLYFIHCVAYLISKESFTGVYIIESLSLMVSLYYIHKITGLYYKSVISYVIAPIFSFVALNSTAFYYGDSAEELVLPMLMCSIYHLLIYIQKRELSLSVYLLIGCLAGCVMMVKFTLVGFWFGWMAFLALDQLFAKKIKKAFVNSFCFLGGMFLTIAPWLIYFLYKDGLYDFINTYFLINATAYSTETVSLVGRVVDLIYNYFSVSKQSTIVFILSNLGMISVLFCKKFGEKIYLRMAIPVVFLCGAFFVYIGGTNFHYYYFPFVAFIPFVFLSFGKVLEAERISVARIVCCFLAVGALVASNQINVSSLYVHRNKADTVQYKFLQYIDSKNADSVLLNYDMLDAGFYLFNNSVPPFKHFERQNINPERFAENTLEQKRYIKEKMADYIVVRSFSDDYMEAFIDENPTIESDYELVKQEKDRIVKTGKLFATQECTYYLFELKER